MSDPRFQDTHAARKRRTHVSIVGGRSRSGLTQIKVANVQISGHVDIDRAQEPQEFTTAMATMQFIDDHDASKRSSEHGDRYMSRRIRPLRRHGLEWTAAICGLRDHGARGARGSRYGDVPVYQSTHLPYARAARESVGCRTHAGTAVMRSHRWIGHRSLVATLAWAQASIENGMQIVDPCGHRQRRMRLPPPHAGGHSKQVGNGQPVAGYLNEVIRRFGGGKRVAGQSRSLRIVRNHAVLQDRAHCDEQNDRDGHESRTADDLERFHFASCDKRWLSRPGSF